MAVAARRRRRRDRRRRLDAGLPRHGHRHRQADAGRAGRGAAPLHRPRRPVRRLHRRRLPGGRATRRSPTSTRAATGALLVGGTGLYLRAVDRPTSSFPGQWPDGRAPSSRPSRDDGARCTPGCDDARPGRRRADRADQPAPHRAGARGHARQRPAVHLVRPGLDAYPPTAVRPDRPALAARRARRRASSGAFDAHDATPAWSTRSQRSRAGRPVAHRRARRSATRSCSPTSTARCSLDEARRARRSRRTRQFAVRQERGSGATPAIRWIDVDDDPVAERARSCWQHSSH